MRRYAHVCGLILATLGAGRAAAAQARSNYEELQTFSGVLNYIRVNYVDSVHYDELVRAAIDGVLRSLDPHSRFQSREEVERAAALTRGDLGSIGLTLEDVDGVPTVLTVVANGPADRSGVSAGDRVVAIDDTTVAGLDDKALELKLAGRPGSRVTLDLERGPRLEPRRYRVRVKRDRVRQASVPLSRMLDSTTGYVWLAEFHTGAADEVERAVNQLKRERAGRLVLDLRGNPGGSVAASVDVASLFLPRNTVVFRTRGRKSHVEEDFVTRRDGRFADLPLVVLIDQRSASAAEVLAGSLQEHDRALLVGQTSFGKALMQAPFALPAGDVVWLTIGWVLTPSGRFIQRPYRGLRPEQYLRYADRRAGTEDTSRVFRSDAGRIVRGGGGVRPDVELPAPPPPPAWHALAADSGFEQAVADSVALTLPATAVERARWRTAGTEWERRLLTPFLARVRTRLNVAAQPDSAARARMARRLAARVAEVRWGPDARDEFLLATDSAVAQAVELLGRSSALLAPPHE